MIHLETQRLKLRPFQETDLDAFATYRSDPEVARYQSWTTPFTLDQAKDFFEELKRSQPGAPGMWYQLAIERQIQPGIIGDCAFHIIAKDDRQAYIGYTLSRQYQKQGYATEAVGCLLNYLFGTLGLHRVIAICDAENPASARLLERVGMRREGHFIENIWFKGAWGSEYSYAILHSEWSRRLNSKVLTNEAQG
jgi:RimJ/RimL family protein N-acetyltransferase